MKIREHARIHDGAFGRAVGVTVAVAVGAKLVWGWLIPELAFASVEQGLISGVLPWSSAFVLGIGVGCVSFLLTHSRGHRHRTANRAEEVLDA
ncbi:MAG: hypothetical protein PVJ76_17300 [Gemmatimonadota bacterium]|jgi:hypothetical protein